jgi:hypothetical protein
MRRIVVILALSVFCAGVSAQAQEKPRIAVYAIGGEIDEDRETLTSYLVRALNKTGLYTAVDRSKGGMTVRDMSREFSQNEGMDEKQAIKTGRRFVEEYYCFAQITPSPREPNMVRVKAQMNHTETDTIVASTDPIPNKLEKDSDLDDIAQKLVAQMLPDLKAEREKVREAASKQTLRSRTDQRTNPDNRDGGNGRQYQYWEHPDGGRTKWFMEDLAFNTGRYSSSEYPTACPGDWRVPNESEWKAWKTYMEQDRNKDLKERFYRDRNNRKRNGETGLYWWSKTSNQCDDDVKGKDCGNSFDNDNTKPQDCQNYDRKDAKGKTMRNDKGQVIQDRICKPYAKLPMIRCVHD